MPSTYTGSGIELLGSGEQSGSWGDTTNNNMRIINRLVSEAGVIALVGTTHTLAISDGTLSEGQYAVLVFGGSPSGTNTVTLSPNDAKRVLIAKNDSGQTVILTQGSGGSVTLPAGSAAIMYCDGAGASAAVVNISAAFVTPTLSAIGNLAPTDGNFVVGNGSTWVVESGDTVLQSLGVTATAAELNTMDGVTATAAELNIMDGVTATTTEINFTGGVTSNIQAQLDAKASRAAVIAAGTGLIGGGDLSANRTIAANIASQAEAEAGTAADKLMTPERTKQAIGATAIGQGQAYQIVTGSRTAGTTYTNNTGKPIIVSVQAFGPAGLGAACYVRIVVDGVEWDRAQITDSTINGDLAKFGNVQAVVLNGATYVVEILNGGSVTEWRELR